MTEGEGVLRHYYWLLLVGFSLCASFLLGYYLFSLPTTANVSVEKSTKYTKPQAIDGYIQPLPAIESIDGQWLQLGKALFHSNLLSKDNTISCASCHMIDYGGDDGFPVSTGVNSQVGERNSPTVLNAVFNFRQFWDGRAKGLAEQAAGPVHNPIEMATNWPEVINKLQQDHYFSQAFSRLGVDQISSDAIVKAIVVFQQSLVTPNAPIDRYLLGEKEALDSQQIRGFQTFQRLGCVTCHQGRNIGGNLYQKVGRIDQLPESLKDDLGLFTLSQQAEDKHVFKVPSLRNVAQTAPYFHNGSVASLEQAVTIMAKVQLGIDIAEQDRDDIVAFLHSLSAPVQSLSEYETK
nr:cytochrome c peroxidase [Marinifaba aquimaris]